MTRVGDTMRLYAHYVRLSARGQLQYRASFVMSVLGLFLLTASEVIAVWALFDRFGQIRGWTLPEVALFYGSSSIAFALSDTFNRGFDQFAAMVRDGGFDRLLLRPRSTVLQLLGQITLRKLGRLVQGTLVLAYAATAGTIDWTVPRALLLAASIACGVCAFSGVTVLQATSAFWTVDALEVWNAFTDGGVTMSSYPLAIYRSWFRAFFIFVIPLGCVSYFPCIAILGHADPLGTPALLGWLAPLTGPAFLLLALQVWRLGVRHYRSTGS